MYNSREIGELRADVAVNCRTLIERAAARGLPVLVVQTVRDAEYQRYLVSMATRPGRRRCRPSTQRAWGWRSIFARM